MARINLLPWREERRLEQNKNFYVVLGMMAFLGLSSVFLVDLQFKQQVKAQVQRNQYIIAEQKKLDEEISEIKSLKDERERLEERMEIIQNLQGNRSLIVHYFSAITKSIPDGVYLTKVERKGVQFNMEGVAEANNRVSNFMRNLDGSDWFDKPTLTSVVADENDGSNVFMLNVGAVSNSVSEEVN